VFQLKSSPLHGSVFALALTALVLLATLLLRPFLAPHFFLPFWLAVFCSAWLYGRPGGLVATALSSIALGFLLVELRATQPASNLSLAVGLLSFVAMSLMGAWLISGWLDSRNLLAATLASIADGVLATDRDERITFVNPVAEALTGWKGAEALGKPLAEVLRVIEEATRQPAASPVRAALRAGAPPLNSGQLLLIAKDQTEIAIEHSVAPLCDDSGSLRGAILVFRDISGRRQLEEQLNRAGRMDAVGRLASGVAGDFNNALTVITGYSDLLRGQMPASSPLRRFADEIQYAGERATRLTRQLLEFSRGQAAQPRVLDLNVLIAGMEPMLRRILGEAIDLIVLPGQTLGRVKVDASQIEQAILNLASNARDAMPNGGKLVIETANAEVDESTAAQAGVQPGGYILLAVSDTGCGMDAQTRARLFEPFFTTKEQGKGSGLGLSIVYGTVRQAGGYITVYSQVNCGTILEIYLPRNQEPLEAPAPRRGGAAKGSETILVVEDEEGVRKLISAVLQNGGYTVLEANNGSVALATYEKNAHKIDLVLSDVVMPQMTGLELGQRLAEKDPDLRMLYMSAYRDAAIGQSGQADKPFLSKPFAPDALLAKVREVLDG